MYVDYYVTSLSDFLQYYETLRHQVTRIDGYEINLLGWQFDQNKSKNLPILLDGGVCGIGFS